MPRCYKARPQDIVASLNSRDDIAWKRFPSSPNPDMSQLIILRKRFYDKYDSFADWYRPFKRKYMHLPRLQIELFFGSEILLYRIPEGGVTKELWLEVLDYSGFKFAHLLCY
ncbi:hypothetical protein TWF506_011497 [Arthrobotrys conoides]|uniref:Uncharacterized protein n=1 Tax=Arthrobotrys conoides TaxID=74498 RepID=A0AAN8NL68_9PEZI